MGIEETQRIRGRKEGRKEGNGETELRDKETDSDLERAVFFSSLFLHGISPF
ncbi:hypothetical protein Csa_011758 [Cucumis sativus]|uniref:Uncharacterized protein n=1 Tax=Cucumis sativus TaxID=3659 RepID=A0A0A0L7K4_CUCSA|nr:hypothetical protein Csa_011758 [Cucumis sativus]